MLIEWGADVNKPSSNGEFPLYLAVQEEKISTVKLLLKRGANVNQKTSTGQTALHQACTCNMTRKYKTLLCE